MLLRYYLDSNGDRVYTLKSFDPENKPTFSAHPARFTPEDRYSRHRITLKSRFGILPSQGTPIVY